MVFLWSFYGPSMVQLWPSYGPAIGPYPQNIELRAVLFFSVVLCVMSSPCAVHSTAPPAPHSTVMHSTTGGYLIVGQHVPARVSTRQHESARASTAPLARTYHQTAKVTSAPLNRNFSARYDSAVRGSVALRSHVRVDERRRVKAVEQAAKKHPEPGPTDTKPQTPAHNLPRPCRLYGAF